MAHDDQQSSCSVQWLNERSNSFKIEPRIRIAGDTRRSWSLFFLLSKNLWSKSDKQKAPCRVWLFLKRSQDSWMRLSPLCFCLLSLFVSSMRVCAIIWCLRATSQGLDDYGADLALIRVTIALYLSSLLRSQGWSLVQNVCDAYMCICVSIVYLFCCCGHVSQVLCESTA